MRIPPELLGHIVVELASADNQFQYGYQPSTLLTLVRLCQISRTAHTITAPHLYSTVVILDAHQLSLFYRTVSSTSFYPHCHTRSISLYDFPDALAPPYSIFLADLLHRISPYLRRLVMSRSLRQLHPEDDTHSSRPALRAALESCTLLEEFASVQCELYLDDNPPPTSYVCWPYWKFLTRLALHNPDIGQDFLAFVGDLSHLSHLAVDNPDWDEPVDVALMMSVLEQSNPRLQRVIMVDYRGFPANDHYENRITPILDLELVHIKLRYLADGTDIHECWFSDQLNAGTLWGIQPNSINLRSTDQK